MSTASSSTPSSRELPEPGTRRGWDGDEQEAAVPPALARRRAALSDLGAAVRTLTHAVVDTETDDDVLAEAAALARKAADLLGAVTRPLNQLSSVEDLRPMRRLLSPVVGPGNPVSPPVTIVRADPRAGRLEATVTLHRVHEGPPTYGHGGMSAMILDQVLGHVVLMDGSPGLTRSLTVRYLRPVPLGVPLRVSAELAHRDGSLARATGVIARQDEPGVPLVEAEAAFLVPRPEQVARLFGHVEVFNGGAVPTGD